MLRDAGVSLTLTDFVAEEPLRIDLVDVGFRGKVPVASFVEDHYAANFGEQWSRFRDTQLDSASGTDISRDFLEALLDQPLSSLEGLVVLEVGSGAGRFTEHLVQHASAVVATDLSEAIYVNAALGSENLLAIQANILEGPTFLQRFDLVLCRGVLQHTPDPVAAIRTLCSKVKPGGRLVFDIYGKAGISRLRPKYLWRPIIRKVFTYDSFSRFLDRWTPTLLKIRWRIKPLLPGPTWRILDYLIPIWDHKGSLPLTDEQLVEWSKLDTLDAMFARFDNPMSPSEVIDVLLPLQFRTLSVDPHRNFYRLVI